MSPAPRTFADGDIPTADQLAVVVQSGVLVYGSVAERDADRSIPAADVWSFTLAEGVLWYRGAGGWSQVLALAGDQARVRRTVGQLPALGHVPATGVLVFADIYRQAL